MVKMVGLWRQWAALLVALVLPLAAGAASDGRTTETLRLADLFDLKPGEPGFSPRPPSHQTDGPVLLRPDTNLWRLPVATPTPTPVPVDPRVENFGLPRLPMLIAKPREESNLTQPILISRGRQPGVLPLDRCRIRIQTSATILRWSVEFTPVSSASQASNSGGVRVLHAPQTDEVFEMPTGEYQLTISAWRANAPQRAVQRQWRAQRLRDEAYELMIDARMEAEFLRLLDRRVSTLAP